MNANATHFGGLFFRHHVSVYALCAMMALPALGQSSGGSGNQGASGDSKDVKVSDYGTVDISVQDTDLATVLQMLSIESKKNIITSKGVSATVSANLYDVTLHEALKAILEVNGYTFYEEGNFIYVITQEEADALAKARRKTESRIFVLNYLSASDASEFISPLLSENGKISARGTALPGMKPEISNNGADEYAFAPRIVVNDYPEHLERIAGTLSELDTPPHQVLVEATILSTLVDETNAFGVDFSVLGNINFTDLTNPLSAVNNLLSGSGSGGYQPPDNNGQAATSTVGNTTGPAGLKVGIMSDDISVFLRVLDEVTDTTVLARPKVMALNRQRAEVLVGKKVGYLSTTSTETTTTQNVQFLDTGIHLIFRPFISTDGMIRMELRPRVSEAQLRDVTDSAGSIVTIPDELTNEVTTNVRVQDGQTIVLGGLFRESNKTTRRQVPLLGDIPILGAAFRGNDDDVDRSEVIFLITPSIMQDADLWKAGEEQLAYADALRVGGRANLLPFSREKVTGNYNQKAYDAYHAGDHDKAMYYINNSLGLSPNQPEMIRLREKITGEKAKAHERSLMERTFRKEFGSPGAISMTPADTTTTAETGSATDDAFTSESMTSVPNTTTEETSSSTTNMETISAETSSTDESISPVVDASATTESNSTDNSATSYGMNAEPTETTPTTDTTTTEVTGVTEEPEYYEVTAEDLANRASNSTSTTSDVPADAVTDGSPSPDSQSSVSEVNKAWEWMFYQQFLYNFFTTLDMPELAFNFEQAGEQYVWELPFTTFDDATLAGARGQTVAGVNDSSYPNN